MSPTTSPETCVGPIRDDAGLAGDECARVPPNSILSPMGEMSDQSDQDRSGSASGAKSSAGSDLDDALALAASLAADLAVELGEAPPPSASAPSDASPSAPAVDAASLDSELSKLEDLVDETAKEIAPDSGGSSSGVPESMSEFTEQPAEQADGSADESPTPSGAPTGEDASSIAPPEEVAKANLAESVQSGVVGTGMLGVVGNIKKPSPIGSRGASPADGAAVGEASSGKATLASGPITRIRAIISERIAPVLYAVSERAVGVLEKIDAPFGRVGAKARDLIGWVALATVATSILVLILASL